jgi:signal transduction histidine kinase
MENKGKSLRKTLKKYYLVLMLLTAAAVAAVSTTTYFISILAFRNDAYPPVTAQAVAKPDYESMSTEEIEKLGGWVEIIHKDQVVYVKGDKKDDKLRYTPEELNYYQIAYGKNVFIFSAINEKDGQYSYSMSAFTGNDGELYACLVKIPAAKVQRTIGNLLDFNNPLFARDRLNCLIIAGGIGIFGFLSALCIFFFARKTSEKVSRPMKKICDGIEKMSTGDYAVRLSFEAESEFAAIRDVFNDMAGQLETAENEKRVAEESRKNMIMGISHDLKTPITTIYGFAKALDEGIVDEEGEKRRYLRYIISKAETMTKLIDGLFKFASLEGGCPLEKEEGDIAEFLRELLAESFVEIDRKGFQLDLDIPEQMVPFEFDKKEMGRALNNILDNCLKYNPPGTALHVSLKREQEQIVLTFRDNGIGIPIKLRESIFTEFTRGSDARQNDGGSGLGLAITRRIIHMHGGRITLAGDTGKGSAFIIHLPGEYQTPPLQKPAEVKAWQSS